MEETGCIFATSNSGDNSRESHGAAPAEQHSSQTAHSNYCRIYLIGYSKLWSDDDAESFEVGVNRTGSDGGS